MSETVEKLEQELLAVDAEIAGIQTKITPLQQQITPLQRRLADAQQWASDVRNKLAVARQAPRVSDHAVIRYLERKYGFSFDDIREEIMTPTTIAAINAGANAVKVNSSKFVVKDKTIVTCHG